MNRWLQTKQYTCRACGASYLHDKGYRHALFVCLKQDLPKRREGGAARIPSSDVPTEVTHG
jgi:hypothetical protein